MPVNHAKEYLIFVHTGVVFLHFLAWASNGHQYSNFENKCPKRGTRTPEDIVLTNLGDSLDSDPSGFVLLGTYVNYNEGNFKKEKLLKVSTVGNFINSEKYFKVKSFWSRYQKGKKG